MPSDGQLVRLPTNLSQLYPTIPTQRYMSCGTWSKQSEQSHMNHMTAMQHVWHAEGSGHQPWTLPHASIDMILRSGTHSADDSAICRLHSTLRTLGLLSCALAQCSPRTQLPLADCMVHISFDLRAQKPHVPEGRMLAWLLLRHQYCKTFWTCTNRGSSFQARLVSGGLLVCSRAQNFACDWCMSDLFCNTA